MSGNRRFVDANVLLYAHDDSAGDERDRARALVERLWESREGCLSVQVLQEFFVNVTRKIAKPLDAETAKAIVADFSRWYLHVPGTDDVLAAIGLHQRTGISFWDAMILRSAAESGCAVLYSEDLDSGQEYSRGPRGESLLAGIMSGFSATRTRCAAELQRRRGHRDEPRGGRAAAGIGGVRRLPRRDRTEPPSPGTFGSFWNSRQ